MQKGYTTGQFGKLENSDNEGLFHDMRAFDRFFTGTNYQVGVGVGVAQVHAVVIVMGTFSVTL